MDNAQKSRIAEDLKSKMALSKLSQGDAARFTGVSKTNISFICGDKWQDKVISDEQWLKITKWLGYGPRWRTVETKGYKRVHRMCEDAKRNGVMIGISDKQGAGKSYALKAYVQKHPQYTYYLECHSHWMKREFLNNVLKAMGIDTYHGSTLSDMVSAIANHLNRGRNTLLILDEADELSDCAFRFIKTFYNLTRDQFGGGQAGFIVCGGHHLRKRLERGVKQTRQSYQEIFSRLGGDLKTLAEITRSDIEELCSSNGLMNREHINEVIECCFADQDMRAIERKIHAIKLREERHPLIPDLEEAA